jgi:hypothetical protein
VLPKDTVGGESCLVVKQGTREIRVAFVGSLAIAASDKALLEQALRRKGREEESGRPVEARMVFEGSPGLLKIRKALQDSGLFPYVKWPTARGGRGLGRPERLHDDRRRDDRPRGAAPSVGAARGRPVLGAGRIVGVMITNTGGQDLIAWVRSLMTPGRGTCCGEPSGRASGAR